jgi:hypothetical protein
MKQNATKTITLSDLHSSIEGLQKAYQTIVDHRDKTTAVNYAVHRAQAGIFLIGKGPDLYDLHYHALRVLGDITAWRGAEATESRNLIKDFVSKTKGIKPRF